METTARRVLSLSLLWETTFPVVRAWSMFVSNKFFAAPWWQKLLWFGVGGGFILVPALIFSRILRPSKEVMSTQQESQDHVPEQSIETTCTKPSESSAAIAGDFSGRTSSDEEPLSNAMTKSHSDKRGKKEARDTRFPPQKQPQKTQQRASKPKEPARDDEDESSQSPDEELDAAVANLWQLNYEIKNDGTGPMKLKDENGSGFQFTTQDDYEMLGGYLEDYVYALLRTEGNLVRKMIPIGAKDGEGSFIFVSKNWATCDKLLILIHGTGVVRAGQWARRLIINNDLDMGTQLPYIRRAHELNYGVIVTNTNDFKRAEGCTSSSAHGIYVWEHFVSRANATQIAIVAHSAGGSVTTSMLNKFEDDFKSRVYAIAFTDSGGSPSSSAKKYFEKVMINWVTSSEKLGTPLRGYGGGNMRSAGCTKHEETSYYSMGQIFEYFQERFNDPAPAQFSTKAAEKKTNKKRGVTSAPDKPKDKNKVGPSLTKPPPVKRLTPDSALVVSETSSQDINDMDTSTPAEDNANEDQDMKTEDKDSKPQSQVDHTPINDDVDDKEPGKEPVDVVNSQQSSIEGNTSDEKVMDTGEDSSSQKVLDGKQTSANGEAEEEGNQSVLAGNPLPTNGGADDSTPESSMEDKEGKKSLADKTEEARHTTV